MENDNNQIELENDNNQIDLWQPQQEGMVRSVGVYSGPLPPPGMLAQYEDISPGFAERIVAMAERQAAHRQKREAFADRWSVLVALIGQIFAFILAMTTVLGGFYLAYTGKPLEGIAAVISSLAILAGVFVYGKRRQNNDSNRNHPPE
jgi:uncharacterized membrane protein